MVGEWFSLWGRRPHGGLCVVVPPSAVGREKSGWALPPQHVGWIVCGMHIRLVGLGGGGEWSPGEGVCGAVLFWCQRLPCGSAAAAAMLWVWCSHEYVESAVQMSSIRQPLSHRDGGSL